MSLGHLISKKRGGHLIATGRGAAGRSGDVYVDDRVWRSLLGRLNEMSGAKLKVGVLASDGGAEAHTPGSISIIELAAIHEFGSPAAGIPERSFLRAGMREAAKTWLPEMCRKLVKGVVIGRFTPEQALDMLGAKAAASVKNYITAGAHIPPPLAPATIARKGSDRPLVDTGRLVDAISWEVAKESV